MTIARVTITVLSGYNEKHSETLFKILLTKVKWVLQLWKEGWGFSLSVLYISLENSSSLENFYARLPEIRTIKTFSESE